MDSPEYTTLTAALKGLPDPRQHRGQRYPWSLLIMAALLSGERHGRGLGQWVQEHAAEWGARLDWPGPQLPSEATLRRALCALDLGTLEDCLMRIRPATESPKPGRWQGQALDGKALRGAHAHDRPSHLLGLLSHQGRVLAQLAVAEHANEITAAPALLAGWTLQGTVTTLDAELTQGSLAAQIRAPGTPNGGQGQSTTLLRWSGSIFQYPVWQAGQPASRSRVARTVHKGHGRLEIRPLEAYGQLGKRLSWPGVRPVLCQTCRRGSWRRRWTPGCPASHQKP